MDSWQRAGSAYSIVGLVALTRFRSWNVHYQRITRLVLPGTDTPVAADAQFVIAVNNYRRHLEFTNLALEIGGDPFRVAVPNIGQFRRFRTELSDSCHFQLDPAATVNHPQRTWFIEGTARVKAALDLLRSLRSQVNGLILPDSMPSEVREVFQAFLAEEIDTQTARTRLRLMHPVLEERLRKAGRRPGFRRSEP